MGLHRLRGIGTKDKNRQARMGLVSMVTETGSWVVVSLGRGCLQGTFSGLGKTLFEAKFEKCLSGLE